MYFLLALDFVPLFLYENRFTFTKCALSKLYKNIFFFLPSIRRSIQMDPLRERRRSLTKIVNRKKKKEIEQC